MSDEQVPTEASDAATSEPVKASSSPDPAAADDEAVAPVEKASPIKVVGAQVERGQSWINEFQARHFIIAFPFAVFRKYADDKASRLAALMTYYGFISIFPILLLLVEIVHVILKDNSTLADQIINTIVPEPLRDSVLSSVQNLPTGGWPLVVGIVSLLLAGMGGAYAAYATVTQIMQIPYRKWYGFGPRYLRVVITLFLLIFGAIGLGGLIALSTNAKIPVFSTPGWAYLITMSFLFIVLYVGIVLLSPRKVFFREVWLGCLLASAALLAVIYLAAKILAELVNQRASVYGVFASFIGLLALMFLMAQVVVISAEISTVWAWHLWPRSIDIFDYFEADVRAMKLLANMEERMPRERITVNFVDDADDDPDPYAEEHRKRGTGDARASNRGTRDARALSADDSN